LPVWNDNPARTAQAIAEGIQLALFQDNRFKSERKSKERAWNKLIYSGLAGQDDCPCQSHLCWCDPGTGTRRRPSSVTPITMAETAQAIALEHDLQVEILESGTVNN